MMRSMYAGVAGLKTHQTKMDVIGNNIANVNTVAYKSQSVTFAELMYQTTQSASGPNAITGTGGVNARQIGLGVKASAINTNISAQGASQTTNNPFDIQITGETFFIVSNGSENLFTRDGSFYVDGVGNLAMTSKGYNVMGWGVDEKTMTIKKDTVQPLRIMSPENLTYPPEATSKSYLSGIIDKNDTNVTGSSGKNINLKFYDALGYAYTARLNLKSSDVEGEYALSLGAILDENNEPIKDAKNMPIDLSSVTGLFGGTQNVERTADIALGSKYKWDANGNLVDTTQKDGNGASVVICPRTNPTKEQLTALAKAYGYENIDDLKNLTVTYDPDADAATDNSEKATAYDIIMDANGVGKDYADAKLAELKKEDPNITTLSLEEALTSMTSSSETITGFKVKYDPTTGIYQSVDGQKVEFIKLNLSAIKIGGESKFEDIEIDLTATTMFNNSGSSTISATSGDVDGKGCGRKLGEMSGISIQQNGMIYASYDNGQTKLLGQIAVADFPNASGLERKGDNLYAATLNSGEFDGIGTDITSGGGYMNSGVLEMSNVDLSAEFTEMITTQRGFQANSRIITVSDTMLEELVNLKR